MVMTILRCSCDSARGLEYDNERVTAHRDPGHEGVGVRGEMPEADGRGVGEG